MDDWVPDSEDEEIITPQSPEMFVSEDEDYADGEDPAAPPNEDLPMSEDEDDELPQEVIDLITDASTNLMPKKSRGVYENAYRRFMDWKHEKNIRVISEAMLLGYFNFLSRSMKPSSLWAMFSMLKSTLNAKEDVNIGSYHKLIAFLKNNGKGYRAIKSSVFTSNNVLDFLEYAPDDRFLATKVSKTFRKSSFFLKIHFFCSFLFL